MKVDTLRRHVLSLPGAIEAPHFTYTSFRVRGKIFMTVPPDGLHAHIFVPEPERETALALEPEVCAKLWWGSKVLGLKVALAAARPAFVKGLVWQAWVGKGGVVPGDNRSVAGGSLTTT